MFFFVPGLDAELLRVARLASTQVSLDTELRSGFTNLEVGQSEKPDIVPANDNVRTKGDGKADGASKFPEIIHVLPWLPPRSSETPSLQTLEHRIQEKVWTTSGPSALHHQTPDAKNSAGLEKAGGSSSSLRQDMRLHDGSTMECSGLEKASETHLEMNADVKVKERCNFEMVILIVYELSLILPSPNIALMLINQVLSLVLIAYQLFQFTYL